MNTRLQFDPKTQQLTGPAGSLSVPATDEQTRRFLMLVEGQCLQAQVADTAKKYGFCRQRYYQMLAAFSRAACPPSSPRRPAPNPTIAAPTNSSAKSCATVFWIPMSPPPSSSKNSAKPVWPSVCAASNGSSPITACKKKLYALNPKNPPPPLPVQRAGKRQRLAKTDPASIEGQVRQTLADKVSGNLLGLWLLAPEHLRLGSWDLLRAWSGAAAGSTWARAWPCIWCMKPHCAGPACATTVPCGTKALNWSTACRGYRPTAPCMTCWPPTPSRTRNNSRSAWANCAGPAATSGAGFWRWIRTACSVGLRPPVPESSGRLAASKQDTILSAGKAIPQVRTTKTQATNAEIPSPTGMPRGQLDPADGSYP